MRFRVDQFEGARELNLPQTSAEAGPCDGLFGILELHRGMASVEARAEVARGSGIRVRLGQPDLDQALRDADARDGQELGELDRVARTGTRFGLEREHDLGSAAACDDLELLHHRPHLLRTGGQILGSVHPSAVAAGMGADRDVPAAIGTARVDRACGAGDFARVPQALGVAPVRRVDTLLQARPMEAAKGERVEGEGVQALVGQPRGEAVGSSGIRTEARRDRLGQVRADAERLALCQAVAQRQRDLADPRANRIEVIARMKIHAVRQPHRAARMGRVFEPHPLGGNAFVHQQHRDLVPHGIDDLAVLAHEARRQRIGDGFATDVLAGPARDGLVDLGQERGVGLGQRLVGLGTGEDLQKFRIDGTHTEERGSGREGGAAPLGTFETVQDPWLIGHRPPSRQG